MGVSARLRKRGRAVRYIFFRLRKCPPNEKKDVASIPNAAQIAHISSSIKTWLSKQTPNYICRIKSPTE